MSLRSLYVETFVKKNKWLNISYVSQRIWVTTGYVKADKEVFLSIRQREVERVTATV